MSIGDHAWQRVNIRGHGVVTIRDHAWHTVSIRGHAWHTINIRDHLYHFEQYNDWERKPSQVLTTLANLRAVKLRTDTAGKHAGVENSFHRLQLLSIYKSLALVIVCQCWKFKAPFLNNLIIHLHLNTCISVTELQARTDSVTLYLNCHKD